MTFCYSCYIFEVARGKMTPTQYKEFHAHYNEHTEAQFKLRSEVKTI